MYRNPSGNARRISAKAAILATSLLFPVRMTSRVRATGLEYTMEHPASSRRVATVHRTVAFTWVRVCRLYQKREPLGALFFGAGDRTRTCTAKPEEPKSTESTNSTTPAYCLQPGYFIMGTGECQWTAVGTLEISRRKRAVFTIFVIFVLDIPARCL